MATISSLSSRTHLLHHSHSARRPSKTPQPQNLSLKSLSPNPFQCLVFQTPRKHSPQRLFSVAAEETSTATSSPPSARRLYVGNIPRNVTDDQLAKLFEEHGSIEKAEVMYDKYSKRSRRFGFVTMKTVEDANAAIEKLNGTEVEGRQIKVNVTEKPLDVADLSLLKGEETQFVDSPHKVYVGNLAKTVTSEILKKFFADEGKVLGAKVSRVPGTSKSTAFGFVTFASDEDAEAAINFFNNTILEGQRIRVNKA